MNKTIGTASNKIYEYAACGLPIIYFKSKYFDNILGKYSWAMGSNLNAKDLGTTIIKILENWDQYSSNARNDFIIINNFESAFKPALNFLSSNDKI